MKIFGLAILALFVVFFTTVSSIQVREPNTEREDALSDNPTTEPSANGQAVGEAPDTHPTGSQLSPEVLKSLEDEVSTHTITTTTVIGGNSFPENHKNFTGDSTSLELPPFMQEYNKYQQQYKEFYAQKNQYAATAKPFRFEDLEAETPKTRLVTQGINAFGNEGAESGVNARPRHPFPYALDHGDGNEPAPSAYPLPDDNLVGQKDENESDDFSELFPFPGLPSPFKNLFGTFPPKTKPIEAQGHRSEVAPKHKGIPPWKRMVKLLSTVLPVGLFLATLTPNLIYINSTNVDSQKPSRLRSGEQSRQTRSEGLLDPLVVIVERFGGLQAMDDPQCEDRFFCEMSLLGRNENSNFIERGFWYLANETPESIAQEVGMDGLFQAIKNSSCDTFKCPEKTPNSPTEVKEIDVKEVEHTSQKPDETKESKKIRKFKKFIRS